MKFVNHKASSFECMEACFTSCDTHIRLLVVYRLIPRKRVNGITSEQFFTEFTELVDQLVMKPAKLIMVGDFNIHWDVQCSPDTKRLIDLLHSLDLQQTITEPTHDDGHTIDLVVSRQADNLLKSSYVSSQISDHCVVHAILNVSKPSFPCKRVSYRKYGSIDIAQSLADDFANFFQNKIDVIRRGIGSHVETNPDIEDGCLA